MKQPRHLLLLVLAGIALAACDPATPDHDASTADPDPGESTLTIIPPTVASELYEAVITGDEGHHVVEFRPITLEQERLDNEARARGTTGVAPINNGNCWSETFWLYDQAGGVGNRVCFSGTGRIILDYVPRRWFCSPTCQPISYWAIGAGSFWPGLHPGRLSDAFTPVDAGPNNTFAFPAWGPLTSFSVTPSRMHTLELF